MMRWSSTPCSSNMSGMHRHSTSSLTTRPPHLYTTTPQLVAPHTVRVYAEQHRDAILTIFQHMLLASSPLYSFQRVWNALREQERGMACATAAKVLFHALLRVTSRHDTSRHVTPPHVTSCHITSGHVRPRYTTPRHAMSCHTAPSYATRTRMHAHSCAHMHARASLFAPCTCRCRRGMRLGQISGRRRWWHSL